MSAFHLKNRGRILVACLTLAAATFSAANGDPAPIYHPQTIPIQSPRPAYHRIDQLTLAKLAEPTQLAATSDDGTCATHLNNFVCHLAEIDRDLILVWNWTSNAASCAPNCVETVDGYRIYPAASAGIASRTMMSSGMRAAVITEAANVTGAVLGRDKFHTGQCFVVRAFHGADESPDSAPVCVGAHDGATTHPISLALGVVSELVQRVDDPGTTTPCFPTTVPLMVREREPNGIIVWKEVPQGRNYTGFVGHWQHDSCRSGLGVSLGANAGGLAQFSRDGRPGGPPIYIAKATLVIDAKQSSLSGSNADCRATLYSLQNPLARTYRTYPAGTEIAALDFQANGHFSIDVTSLVQGWLASEKDYAAHLIGGLSLRRDTALPFAGAGGCMNAIESATLTAERY